LTSTTTQQWLTKSVTLVLNLKLTFSNRKI
jgi:hypothetical protein